MKEENALTELITIDFTHKEMEKIKKCMKKKHLKTYRELIQKMIEVYAKMDADAKNTGTNAGQEFK